MIVRTQVDPVSMWPYAPIRPGPGAQDVPLTGPVPPGRHSGQAYAARMDEDMPARVAALESLLVEKGYIDPGALETIISTYADDVGPRNGALVVARSWVDPGYRDRLLADATGAIAELGFGGRQGEHMVALPNTPTLHHLVVCTLCSCYPWPVLGLPPTWYKSAPYRSRVVLDPRGVLADFGVVLPAGTRIAVHDSTAEVRYLVVPMRPAGTEGWPTDRLASLVTRDGMIGTALL